MSCLTQEHHDPEIFFSLNAIDPVEFRENMLPNDVVGVDQTPRGHFVISVSAYGPDPGPQI